MKCIADVNVLLPLLCSGHIAERAAYEWFERQEPDSVGWCLPIRLAILHHLCNRDIMGVPLEPEHALDVWRQLAEDERLFAVPTVPVEVDICLRRNVAGRQPSPKLWTDAWLAALAEACGFQMVSFDRDFNKFHLTSLHILEPS